MENRFRDNVPLNTCTKQFADYKAYKIPWLQDDFFNRCGYCNDADAYMGGRRGMQIDHFVPKKKFGTVFEVHAYSNLVYSCFYCNNNKSDDWVTDDPNLPISIDALTGYIHPRDLQYDLAFKRSEDGDILPQNDVSKYMYKVLCLGLKRHKLIFLLEKLYNLYEEVMGQIEDINTGAEDQIKLTEKMEKVSAAFMRYFSMFRKELDKRSKN